ncbi:SigB/SigF/SigG family RNA polymerase sigma factor [Kitasatospora sp. NBC_00315]|uniref:SigB/SigF/SigG family RNA polymerase sigma factor n=1 Tax=Kitasatospora sp. NBC_00315 TaxID=2975963 RepID=UPI0032447ADC
MAVLQDTASATAPGRAVTSPGPAPTALAPAVPAPLTGRAPLSEAPDAMAPSDARALSKDLFLRLRELEEGTREYSYVRGTLIELNMTLVRFAARRFGNRSEPMEDIVQVGTIGLIKAIDRFDPALEYEFSTFALPTITGEMKRFFRDTSWMVHVPRGMQERRLTLAKASDELEQVLDRLPTAGELAAHLSLTEREVIEGMKAANAYHAHSLDAPSASEESGAGSGAGLGARFAVEEAGFEAVLHLESLKPLIAALPERDRRILAMRFGAEMTQGQIGQELGLSQMHISRLLTRILTHLRTALLSES